MLVKKNQTGDTIIEVMVAFTVFAMLAVGSMAIMNRGVASAQKSLESTLVRQQMDGQAEALRFIHQNYVADPATSSGPAQVFKNIIAPDVTNPGNYVFMVDNASEFGGKEGCSEDVPDHGFVINTANINTPASALISNAQLRNMNDSLAPAFSQISAPNAFGLWIEAVKSDPVVPATNQTTFIDFHIRSCWYEPSGKAEVTLGTIVRLYVPAN